MEWSCLWGSWIKIFLIFAAGIVFFEFVIRRATQRNKTVYNEYLKNAEQMNNATLKKSLDNQAEMISLLKEIRDLLKNKN